MARKKSIENIKNLPESWEILATMKKKRSPLTKIFVREPGDDWFVEAITYRTKSGLITKHSLITEPQVNDWIDRIERIMGFKLEKE